MIIINGVPLKVESCVKYLGLWLDRGLRWGRHINETKQKVLRYIHILKMLVGPRWGMHPSHLRRLYISIVRSRIDYASFLYDTSCATHLTKLDKAQNICMRIIGGFIKSTPIHVMEAELGIQPLDIRRRYLAGKFWLKSKSLGDNSTVEILNNLSGLCNNFYWSPFVHSRKSQETKGFRFREGD